MTSKASINLIERIGDGKLSLYVADKKISHEKIYLLEANDGRKRVVMGSANMSYAAFGGYQRENIAYIDGDQGFDWYYQQYLELKKSSTSEISKSALTIMDFIERIDELPIFKKVKVHKAMIIEKDNRNSDDVRFVLSVDELAKKLKSSIAPADRNGKVLLSTEKVVAIRRRIIENQKLDQEKRSEYPALVLDVDNKRAILNDIELDLKPDPEEIKKDVSLFIEYMNGYEKFYGNVKEMQSKYYSDRKSVV